MASPTKQQQLQKRIQDIQTVSAVVARADLAARLGSQYGGDRDVYEALGYPTEISYDDYYARWQRQDIARTIIDKPVQKTWHGDINIQELDGDETAFSKKWQELKDRPGLNIISKLERFDKLIGLGEYAVMLFGFSDVDTPMKFADPVVGTKLNLMYLRPIGYDNAEIVSWEERTNNPRYGLPVTYKVTMIKPDGSTTSEIMVHHSRLLHVADNVLENSLYGEPRLKPVYNRLLDLEKLTGGSAEMFWRGARPGYQGKVDPEFTMTDTDIENLEEQLDEYEHNLRRFLVNKGMELSALAPQVSDPSAHVDIQIQMISMETGIPKRILTGSERGELASSQDQDAWFSLITERRDGFAEPLVFRPFIDRCIQYGVLPAPSQGGYSILWPSLFEVSEKDRADVGRIRAEAVAAYAKEPMSQSIVPVEAFYQFMLGFDRGQIELIEEIQKQQAKDNMNQPIEEEEEEEQ